MSLSHLKSPVFISARNFTFLWNLHHHIMLPLDSSLTHFNPGYFCTTQSSKINLNIPSDLKSPVWPLTLNIFQSKFCAVFFCCMPACYVDRVVFYLNILTVLQQYKLCQVLCYAVSLFCQDYISCKPKYSSSI